jgi:VWFA-related protein
MQVEVRTLVAGGLAAIFTGVLSAGQQAPANQRQTNASEKPSFSVQIDLVTADAIPRDGNGNFVSDLTKSDFEIYEDGVKQDIVSMTLSRGGRITNLLAPPPPPAPEGIILPPPRRAAVEDISGRVFVFFVDDLHLAFQSTPRVRLLFEKIERTLVHDGDLFGIVSSGPSSISVQLTYDRRRLEEAIDKMTGDELKPEDIINATGGTGGPTVLRYRARVAMSTVIELLNNLEQVHNRRKALVYLSDGYDFIPFQAARLGLMDPNSAYLQNRMLQTANAAAQQSDQDNGASKTPGFGGSVDCTQPSAARQCQDPNTLAQKGSEEFADADLARELEELTRTANRANTTIYTIDPRGLVGMSDIDQPVEPTQWLAYVQKTQETLRVLALDTGGIPVVNQNDFDRALKQIDADTSDYYVLGYYSTNPDPARRVRRMDVRVKRPGIEVSSRKEYVTKAVPANPPKK